MYVHLVFIPASKAQLHFTELKKKLTWPKRYATPLNSPKRHAHKYVYIPPFAIQLVSEQFLFPIIKNIFLIEKKLALNEIDSYYPLRVDCHCGVISVKTCAHSFLGG